MLIKVRRYLKEDPNNNHFRHQMLVTIVRHDQLVEIIWATPPRLKAAIARLGQYQRGEFIDRLAVVAAFGGLRRQTWPRTRASGVTAPDRG
jgi:hypothetical protein